MSWQKASLRHSSVLYVYWTLTPKFLTILGKGTDILSDHPLQLIVVVHVVHQCFETPPVAELVSVKALGSMFCDDTDVQGNPIVIPVA